MSLHDMAAFYQQTGQRSALGAGGLWLAETRLSLMSIPSSRLLSPRTDEVRKLLRQTNRAVAVFGCGHETGRWVSTSVVRDRGYGLHSLQRQFRQQVKIALNDCVCRPVAWSEMATVALTANRATMRRRGVTGSRLTDPARWAEHCHAASQVPNYEVMGCFVKGELAAYMVLWRHERICYGLQMFWSDDHRGAHPTHALYYETVRRQMALPDTDAIMVGRQTVPAMTSVDRFKQHAGFVKEPCRVGVVLRPLMAGLFTHPAALRVMRELRGRFGDRNPVLRNFEVFEVAAETRLP